MNPNFSGGHQQIEDEFDPFGGAENQSQALKNYKQQKSQDRLSYQPQQQFQNEYKKNKNKKKQPRDDYQQPVFEPYVFQPQQNLRNVVQQDQQNHNFNNSSHYLWQEQQNSDNQTNQNYNNRQINYPNNPQYQNRPQQQQQIFQEQQQRIPGNQSDQYPYNSYRQNPQNISQPQQPHSINPVRPPVNQSENDGFSEIQTNSQSQLNQQQPQSNSQYINSFTLQIKKQRDSTQQKFMLTKELIDYIFSYSDFEIKVSNISPELQSQLQQMIPYFQNKNMQILLENQSEEELQLKQRIYQIKDAQEIQLSQQDLMVYMYYYQISNIIQKAEQQKLKFLISSAKFQYKINNGQFSTESQAHQFFKWMKTQLDQTIILQEECKTKSEAKIKTNLLNNQRLLDSFAKTLNIKNIKLFASFLLPIDDIAQQLIPYAEQIIESSPKIILAGMNQNNQSLISLQQQFSAFVNKKENIKQIVEKFQYSIAQFPDQNEIDKQINALQSQQNHEIIVTPPQMDLQVGKYIVQIQIQVWMEGYQSDQIAQTKIQAIKKDIKQIYMPTIEIVLKNPNQIKIWQNVLAQEFETNASNKECSTKYIEGNHAIIELQGDIQSTKQKKEQIMVALDDYMYEKKQFQCNEKILKQLKDKNLRKLFKNELEAIAKDYKISLIKIMEITEKKFIFEVFYKSSLIGSQEIEDVLQEQFFDKLQMEQFDMEIKTVLDFLKQQESEFQEKYQVILVPPENKGKQKSFSVIGLDMKIQEISQLVKQIQVTQKNNQQKQVIICQNKLVYNNIKKLYQLKKIDLKDAQIIFTQDEKITLIADKSYIQQVAKEIQQQINLMENQLIKHTLDYSEKEIKFINKNLQRLIDDFVKENEINISYQTNKDQNNEKLDKSMATKLSYEGRNLQIHFADISKIECDAIVNSCNDKLSFGDPTTLSGVAQSIFEMAGSSYHAFCQEYINQHIKLKVGDAITYEMPRGKNIKYIINVATPIYSSGNQTSSDLSDIGRNIKAIFKEAHSLQIQSLALPIFGGGACGYSFSQASDVVLREVINCLFSNEYSVKSVYITETLDSKISELQENLKLILQPPVEKRKIQYQWQWQSDNGIIDYDDEDVNRQIDEAYEKFKQTGQEQRFLLKFPFTKEPGTHQVDLKNLKLIDISLKKELSLTFKIISNSKKYFINNEQVSDQLNEYFMLQEMNKQFTFTLFYKRHEIVFNSQEMCQINLDTKYKRSIQGVKFIDKSVNQQNNLILQGKKYIIVTSQYQKQVAVRNQNVQMFVESFDGSLNQKFMQMIQQEMDKQIIIHRLDVPHMSNEDLQNFEQFLIHNSLKINGVVKQGQQLSLQIFEKKKENIKQYIDKLKLSIKQYPPEWNWQSENYQKIRLAPNSQEYIKILNQFKLTETGTIYEIYRIQNKALWDNYISEKNKLIEIYKQQGIQLQPIEKERYLWHGVRGQHPKIIYEGLKEAFDQTYSNVGMWGAGIYFAENASYSRHYSYPLKATEDRVNAGKLVFLCCLVTTGRVEVKQPDNTIKRPSPGYDCVSGFTNGSNVFIFYSMDIRRAYPAYEIIYS